MYLDRISDSKKYADQDHKALKSIPNFTCIKCKRILGVPIVHRKEKRLAYRLFVGVVSKKIIKAA